MRDLTKLVDQLGALSVIEATELRTMLEDQWASPPKPRPKPKFEFHEGKVCDAMILRLEEREGSPRTNVRSPEEAGHKHPVDLAFELGKQVFALEHTGVEPFDGHLELEAQTKHLFTPISDALKDALDSDTYFEVHLPLHALRDRKKKELETIQQAIIGWVKTTAPTIAKRPYPDWRGTPVGPVKVDGVPFNIVLVRFDEPPVPGRRLQIRHMVENLDELHKARMLTAIENKFAKLHGWKTDESAKSILVLEQNDMQLSNPGIIADTFVPLAKDRADRPDETYLVVSFPQGEWWLVPILIGDRTYDDFVRSDETGYWEFEPAKLQQLTKR